MKIKVLFFATLRDYAGARMVELEVPAEISIAKLKELLVKKYPQMASARNSLVAAIDREYAADGRIISPGAEIALFPPVSGG